MTKLAGRIGAQNRRLFLFASSSLTHLLCLPSRSSKHEWHYRWGPTFGQPQQPPGQPLPWRPQMGPMPNFPPPHRAPQLVEPTESALKWDAAVNRGCVPMRAPSSVASSSARSGAPSLPGMRAVSISSSADRRRELLQERHDELQAQLALVEEMLKQAKPSTMMSNLSGFSAVSKMSQQSHRSVASSKKSAILGAEFPPAPPPASAAPSSQLRPVSEESMPPVPLMLDPQQELYHSNSPFRSVAGTGFAVPGATLSNLSGTPRYSPSPAPTGSY